MAHALPWMDAVLAHVDVGPIVLASVDVKALLALRRVGRQGKEAVQRVFCVRTTRLRLLRETKNLNKQYAFPNDVMRRFAARGELHAMQLARLPGHNVPWNEYVTAWAAFYGRTDMIYWMRFEADPPVPMGSKSNSSCRDENTLGIECMYAAKAGRLDVLDWLRKHGFVMTNDSCCEAARYGHLHVVKRICCVADPYATWIRFLSDEVLLQIWKSAPGPIGCPEWEAHLSHRLETYMPLLEWYIPFATKSEREKLNRWVPLELF